MTEQDAALPHEGAREVDRQLLAECKRYSVPYKSWLEMSVGERGAVKAKYTRGLRHEAKRRGIDDDEFVKMTDEERDRVREEYPERPPGKRKPRTVDEVAQAHAARVADVVDQDLSSPGPYSPASEVPAIEEDPARRDRPTLDEVVPVENKDLVGWETPRNLRDVFARYTIGDGQHYIRVERIEPRVFQQIATSGYLGEIREPLTEEEFHAFYGGRIYELSVYGPDTQGRRDPVTGHPLIKPKTKPFRYTVPMYPPNLAVLPGTNPTKKKNGDPMHPFSMFQSPVLPTTPADASMHKSNLDFVAQVIERSAEESRELRKELQSKGSADVDVLRVIGDQSKSVVEQANRASEARERSLLDQLENEREQRRELAAKLDKLQEQMSAEPRQSPVKDAVELMKVTNPAQTAEQHLSRQNESHRSEVASLKESHRDAIETLKSTHRDAIETMKSRQEEELKRLRERADEIERSYGRRLEDAERRQREVAQEHKDQMEQLRRDERAAADQRVKDTEKRFEDRISDIKLQQERELRMQEEQHKTRVETTKSNLELQLSNQKERVKRLEDEVSEARAELAEAGDPVAVVEKQEKIAKSLGWRKEEKDGPQTAGERFAATVGIGLGKSLEDMGTWLPKVAEAFRKQPLGGPPVGVPPGLPGRRPGPPGQRGPGPGQRRAVAWATQGSIPITDHRPSMPPEAPPAAPPPQPEAAPAPQQQAAPPPEAPPPAAAPAEPAPSNGAAPYPGGIPEIPMEFVQAFRTEVEMSIDGGRSPDEFARLFVERFPDPARELVTLYKAEDLMKLVESLPNGPSSNILRRDGKRWVEKLWAAIPIEYAKMASAAAAAQASSGV
jgi:hypothetical protein